MNKNNHLNQKINNLLLCVLCFSSFSLFSQEIPKQYIAHYVEDSLRIDGKDDDKSWNGVQWTDYFIDIEGEKIPKYKTQVKMVWDAKYLYFFAKLKEPHVWGDITKRDAVIFHNNDFEIFVDPTGDTHNYLEFEINALNTVWDLLLTKPYGQGGVVVNNWDIKGLKTAVDVKGTLNNSADIDTYWTIEIAIPWTALLETSNVRRIPANKFWRVNFSRVHWDHTIENGEYQKKKDDQGKKLPEYNWVWSPQGVISMHKPNKWGYVYFSDKKVDDGFEWEIPKDEYIKWYLYDLYYSTRHQISKSSTSSMVLESKEVLGKLIVPKVEKHRSGWNIWAISPFTNKTLIIKEDGKFSSNEEKK
ncbi:carbohydrate-binding family 9-like protein [Cellulophaga sp. F20128]|uniref:carbohydrate-binding family 9-like protein n=1 Tax=Cellulophaga sp. F20128 TaxID=2926413 RepID=UPI001FF6A481|nr:carbohydrate-binding family 9-like protein [Cellulophaga sp. F20128]MCK0156433.1 carbohydrate-binding family 9-like protein [Cellulophaga sp. F20128]